MTFPQTAAPTETAISTNPTTHVVAMPATVNAGDLLLLIGSFEASGTLSGATGFTSLLDSGPGVRGVWAKVADGSEAGGTLNVGHSVGNNSAFQVYRIQAGSWFGTIATGVAVATIAVGSNDVPALTPSWPQDDTLWIAVYFVRNDAQTVTAYPTNYTNGVDTIGGAGANNAATLGTARRELNAASEDPGTFSASDAGTHTTVLIAIRPAAAAGTTSAIMRRRRGY